MSKNPLYCACLTVAVGKDELVKVPLDELSKSFVSVRRPYTIAASVLINGVLDDPVTSVAFPIQET